MHIDLPKYLRDEIAKAKATLDTFTAEDIVEQAHYANFLAGQIDGFESALYALQPTSEYFGN